MKPMLQILDGVKSKPVMTLPLLATANDIRGVVQYLKNKAAGVTISEAMEGIKKQTFDPRKIAAYESLGIIVKSGDRLKLSSTGRELARSMEPEAQLFRAILDQIEPYRAFLDWVYRQKLDVIVHADAAAFWSEYYPEVSGARDEKTMEGYLICFFQLCQAAALGTHIVGKKGQPTRLRLDRVELLDHIKAERRSNQTYGVEGNVTKDVEEDEFHMRVADWGRRREVVGIHSPEKMNVFISCGKGMGEIAQRIQAALDLADIGGHISERKEVDDTTLLAPGIVEAMRRCSAGVFIVTHDDCRENDSGECTLDKSFQIEIGAAFVLYSQRIIIVCEKGITIPINLKSFCCEYEGNGFSWEIGVRLINSIKNFIRPTEG